MEGSDGGKVKSWLFFVMEAAALLCGLLPFASVVSEQERLMLLLFVPFVLLAGFGMLRVERRYGARTAFIGGVLAVFVTAAVMLAGIGRTGFLGWAAVLAFIFVARAGLWLEGSQTAAERLRSFFLWECFIVPVLILIAFRYTDDQPLIAAAVILFLLIRGFSLIYAQRLNGGHGIPGLQGILVFIGIVLALLLLLLVFPGAMLAFALVGTGVFMLADWLGLDVTFPMLSRELPIVGGGGAQGAAPSPEELGGVAETASIPGVVWLGFVLLVAVLLLAAMYRYRSRKKPADIPANPAIRLVRMKEAGPQRLSYVPGATGIRQVYQALLRGMEEKGWPARPAETPREYAARLGKAHPSVRQEGDALEELVRQYGAARYGVDPPGRSGAGDAGGVPPAQASRLVARLVAAAKPGGKGQ
ncbi:MAG: hypothetical protein K0Q90_1674 [Paenibacillaceae bacterium]|jgi:hypothetical protein|nr:hypothetical protein [Paenibacillaceae bacterium]